MSINSSIQYVREKVIKSCCICWNSTVVCIMMPMVYVTTTIMCCVPIGCYYCCAFINECDKVRKNDTNDVDIVEIKIYEPSLTDNTIYEPYTYSDHIAIQMTENPIHDVINV